jgi:hypothetical protein
MNRARELLSNKEVAARFRAESCIDPLHPLDRVLVGRMEAHQDVAAVLQRLKISDVHTPAAALERIDVTTGGDDTDFAVLNLIEEETALPTLQEWLLLSHIP